MSVESERRKSAIVAIVGDDEPLAAALARAIKSRGASTISLTVDQLAGDPPAFDLAVMIGEPALDGGEEVLGRMKEPRGKVAVVLRDISLAERLIAHRCGALVILRRDNADAMAADIAEILDGADRSELGWTSLQALLELLTNAIGARLSVDATSRTELMLGDPNAVAEVIERCADELGMLAFEARGGEGGPTVAVDELNWDDDPQTAQQSAADLQRWRKLAARASEAQQQPGNVPFRRFLRPPPKDGERASARAPQSATGIQEAISAPTNLAELLEPDDESEPSAPRTSGVVSKSGAHVLPFRPTRASAEEHEEVTVSKAIPLPAVLQPELAYAPPAPPSVAVPEERSAWRPIAIGISALAVIGIGVAIALAATSEPETPRAEPSHAREAAPAPVVEEPAPAPSEPAPAPAPVAQVDAVELADDLVDRGNNHERAGEWEQARTSWERALEADPQSPHALAGLARERLHAGDAPGAIRFAERAVSMRRRRASYRVLLGDAHRLAGDAAAARTHYEAALELDPTDAEAQARLAE